MQPMRPNTYTKIGSNYLYVLAQTQEGKIIDCYGTVLPSSATVFQYGEHPCAYAGAGEGLHAPYCDGGGRRWHHPVVALTGGDPHTWYYDVGSAPRPRPASF